MSARSDDGVIEAVEVLGRTFAVGVQWHPEEQGDVRLFAGLVDAARRRAATMTANRSRHARSEQREQGAGMSDVTDVVNPATEQVIALIPINGVEATDEAVARAHAAGPAWRAVAPADRARLMRRFAAAVEEHHEELAQLETANVGKPIGESRDEVGMVAEVLYFYAGAVDKHRGATVPVAGGVDMTFHEPLGVVGAIIPWNFPVAITSWKVGPALATGNTIVVKPAEITPLTAVRLAELGLEAGLPEGVLQVVTGKGSVVGTRLAEHPDVAKIAFTGSTEVGRDVMSRASGTIKRVTLELGGKSASVVFADADLSQGGGLGPRRGVRQRRPGLLRPQPDPRPARGHGRVPRPAGRRRAGRGRSAIRPTPTSRWARWSRPPTAAWWPASWTRGWVPRAGRWRPTPPAPCPTAPASGSPRRWWPRPTPGGGWPARRSSGPSWR